MTLYFDKLNKLNAASTESGPINLRSAAIHLNWNKACFPGNNVALWNLWAWLIVLDRVSQALSPC